jgi:acylphosphatase
MASKPITAVRAIVLGRVQGVGFRFFVRDEAQRLGLSGWVRNLPDDRSVELVAEGDRASVEELLKAAGRGPSGAHVERVEHTWIEPQWIDQFTIRR